MGLTQINARTAQSLGYQGPASGLLDAETNLRYGLKYLAQAYKLAGGDTCGTILRYQAGHRAQSMTSHARAYCARVKTIIAETD
jgi:soluble lytic murein transglycosylase-like protein